VKTPRNALQTSEDAS